MLCLGLLATILTDPRPGGAALGFEPKGGRGCVKSTVNCAAKPRSRESSCLAKRSSCTTRSAQCSPKRINTVYIPSRRASMHQRSFPTLAPRQDLVLLSRNGPQNCRVVFVATLWSGPLFSSWSLSRRGGRSGANPNGATFSLYFDIFRCSRPRGRSLRHRPAAAASAAEDHLWEIYTFTP